ncbi:carbohydrate ABC transporter permease [Roseisalinus antarcticus]|uniref:Lactose transport system permease protein LacF n=1 Tax=Roseisalinus antarcticus TaxID=254357 RepID=A0A1Y5TA53_9RHOB|nr:sugar ABC transporter permease [Roseisalinus antarcticus]SLN57342.1 Lactose transport system permease protein LacF [Roseisalinus antarcticus]
MAADPARTTARPGAAPRRRRVRPGAREERRFAALFLLPAVLLVVVFRIWPLAWGFWLSLTDAEGLAEPNFIGLENYVEMAGDPNFLASMKNTGILLLTLPVWIMLPMILATLIHLGVPGGKLYRSVYFFPAVLSSVIVGSIFNVVLRYDGALNAGLEFFGIPALDWLGNGSTALLSLITVQLWATFGMSLLIFLAGLATVSQEMIEAARLDGAKLWALWAFIILPSLRPIIEFVAVVTTIGVLTNMFGLIYVLTAGGPGTATTLPEFLIWLEQGQMNRPGYAAALSMVLFVLMAGIAWIQIRIMSRNSGI